MLALIGSADGCARVLTEREHSLGSDLRIAEHGEGNEFIILGSFRIMEDLSNHLIVLSAEHERTVVAGHIGDDCQGLRINHKHLVSVPVLYFHIIFCDELVFRSVRAERKRLLIMERFCWHIRFWVRDSLMQK